MAAAQPEINLANIEKELYNLWKSQKDKNLIKASLFNLIIYANDPERTESLDEMVKTILEKYPCRIIFIHGNPDPQKNSLHTSVTNTIIHKGDNAIGCDRINIEVSYSQLFRVPFVILPLLIPDLPIYLLWGEDPTSENMILPYLRDYASRLIFNSDCMKSLQDFSQKILKEIDTEKLEIRDINWAATGSWREILAYIFNNEEKINLLKSCKNVRIEFNKECDKHTSHPEIQALYLQGWLAAQLGWQFSSFDEKNCVRHMTYSYEDKRILVELAPKTLPYEISGSIHSVEINTSLDNVLIIANSGDQPKATVHITTKDFCEMPYELPLPDMRKGTFLIKELFYRQTSAHYRNMLLLIAQYK